MEKPSTTTGYYGCNLLPHVISEKLASLRGGRKFRVTSWPLLLFAEHIFLSKHETESGIGSHNTNTYCVW